MNSIATPSGAPRVLAIDLACGKTGIAYNAPELGIYDIETIDTVATRTTTGWLREDTIKNRLEEIARRVQPEIILLEDLYVPVKVNAGFISLALLHGVIRHHLTPMAPLVIVNNTHIKIFGCGNGGAEKTAMVLAVERRYGHLVSIADDNQADAFVLLALACAAYGHPVPTADGKKLPDTHLRALTMVTGWPVIAGHESPAGLAATTSRGSGRARKAAA